MSETGHGLRLRVWLFWLGIVVISMPGLVRYRIDNDISRWTPQHSSSVTQPFLLLGMRQAPPDWSIERTHDSLVALPSVQYAVPLPSADSPRGWLLLGEQNATDQEVLDDTQDWAQRETVDAATAGPAVFRRALDDWSQRRLPLVSGLILLIGAGVMFATTRRVARAVEAMVAILSAQMVLVAWIGMAGTPMDMVLSITPPLLMGVGFSFAAHRALRPDVGRVLVLSMLTTAVGIGLFAFTDFVPMRAFGLWGAAGVALTWCAVVLLVKPAPTNTEQTGTVDQACDQPAWRMPRAVAALSLLVGIAVTLVGSMALPRLRVQEDALDFYPPSARVVRDHRWIEAHVTGTLPFIVESDDATESLLTLIADTPGVRWAVPIDLDSAVGTRAVFALADSASVGRLADAQPGWQRWARDHDTQVRWLGVAAQIHAIGRSVHGTARWALPSMIALTALVVALVDRRAISMVMSMWVNYLPVSVLALWIWATDQAVGIPALVISALAIGLAVDDTLHLMSVRRRCGSMADAVARCRRACAGSSLAMALCLLCFALCPFRPTAQFGLMVAAAVVAALFGDLVLLPALEHIRAKGYQEA